MLYSVWVLTIPGDGIHGKPEGGVPKGNKNPGGGTGVLGSLLRINITFKLQRLY